MLATAHFPPHEPGGLQHADVARDACECHRQWCGQVRNAGVAFTQRLQQQSPGRICERAVCTVQYLIFNHLVDYIASS